jgi:hypothetical protein
MEISKNEKSILFLSEMIKDLNKLSKQNFKDEFVELVEKTATKIEKVYNQKCSTCKYFNIKSDEHGICDNPENDFSLRFNASKKGYEMLKDEVKLIDFINEIEPYTTFYIHQDFGCINHCL